MASNQLEGKIEEILDRNVVLQGDLNKMRRVLTGLGTGHEFRIRKHPHGEFTVSVWDEDRLLVERSGWNLQSVLDQCCGCV